MAGEQILTQTLKDLDLVKWYPQKLEIREVITIYKPEAGKIQLSGLSIARSLLHGDAFSTFHQSDDHGEISDKSENDFWEATSNEKTKCLQEKKNHPTDNYLAVILCSGDILRQTLIAKMAQCLLAVPLIIPMQVPKIDNNYNPLVLSWSLRRIILSYKPEKSVMPIQIQILEAEINIVSFIRFGLCRKISNSKTASNLLSSDTHPFFLNEDCLVKVYPKNLAFGMVDMCWSLPSGEGTDFGLRPWIFLNLHGSAENFPLQIKIISECSDICFIFIDEEAIKYLAPYETFLKMLFNKKELFIFFCPIFEKPESKKKFASNLIQLDPSVKERCKVLSGEDQKLHTIRKEFRSISLKVTNKIKLNQVKEKAQSLGIPSYENQPGISTVYDRALKIVNGFILHPKNEVLILQKISSKTVSLMKKQRRMSLIGRVPLNEYQDKIMNELNIERKSQLEAIRKILSDESSPMHIFLKELSGIKNPTILFTWLQLIFEDICRKELPPLLEQFSKLQQQLGQTNETNKPTIEKQLAEITNELFEKRIGIDHLLREVSLLFEIFLDLNKEFCLTGCHLEI